MHIRELVLFVFFVINADLAAAKSRNSNCNECVYYDFEQDFDVLFSSSEACAELKSWTEGRYSSIGIDQPNEYSQSFIAPQNDLSCATSFPFSMSAGGTVYVKLYIDSVDAQLDQVYVLAEQITGSGNNPTVGLGVRSSTDGDFVSGWQKLTINLFSSVTSFDGHIIIMGLVNPGSKVLVDSFCYKPSNFDGECWADDFIVSTPALETTTVTEPTIPVTEATTPVTEPTTSPVTSPTPTTESPTNGTEETTVIATNPTTPIPTARPEPTIPTPALVYRCPSDPFIHWLLPHEEDCNLFYYCVWGHKVLHECPSGLHFNRILQVCDWPQSARCTTK